MSLACTVFGSSSNKTPKEFLDASYELGVALGKQKILCVTGGGSYGCMSAVQNGCKDNNGMVLYVIHQKFVDGGDVDLTAKGVRKVIVAKGDDLSERKRLLIDNGDALIVLPGGCGTFDEFWDCVSHKGLSMKGLKNKPIVVMNFDGYYNGFIEQLHRASKEGLLYHTPDKYFHVSTDPLEAIEYIREYRSQVKSAGVEDMGKARIGKVEFEDKLPTNGMNNTDNEEKKGVTTTSFDKLFSSFMIGVLVGGFIVTAQGMYNSRRVRIQY